MFVNGSCISGCKYYEAARIRTLAVALFCGECRLKFIEQHEQGAPGLDFETWESDTSSIKTTFYGRDADTRHL